MNSTHILSSSLQLMIKKRQLCHSQICRSQLTKMVSSKLTCSKRTQQDASNIYYLVPVILVTSQKIFHFLLLIGFLEYAVILPQNEENYCQNPSNRGIFGAGQKNCGCKCTHQFGTIESIIVSQPLLIILQSYMAPLVIILIHGIKKQS